MSELRSFDDVASELKTAMAEYDKDEPCCEDILAAVIDTLEWVLCQTDAMPVKYIKDQFDLSD